MMDYYRKTSFITFFLTGALLVLALSAMIPAHAQQRGAQVNYILRCAGCHGLDGTGLERGGIPAFPGYISSIIDDDEGRTYLMHVPGVVATGLNDREIAEVMNYVAGKWGSNPDFERFTEEEVRRRRATAVADVVEFRRVMARRLLFAGKPLAPYPWP
jgi:mono/diheme cytochrome c family protein